MHATPHVDPECPRCFKPREKRMTISISTGTETPEGQIVEGPMEELRAIYRCSCRETPFIYETKDGGANWAWRSTSSGRHVL